jgi:hypothetical protein
MHISRLESVPLRELWPNEARDFTTWLAENLDFLGEALGMELSRWSRRRLQGHSRRTSWRRMGVATRWS